jgi:hypothetical protein
VLIDYGNWRTQELSPIEIVERDHGYLPRDLDPAIPQSQHNALEQHGVGCEDGLRSLRAREPSQGGGESAPRDLGIVAALDNL